MSHAGRRADGVALAALAAVITLFYGTYLTHATQLFPGDITDNYYYLFTHLRDRYLAGEVPLWSSRYYAGHPFFGNMHAIFYPGDVLFLLLPVHVAFAVSMWLHVLLGGGATYACARRLGLAPLGAFVAGVLYTCSGNNWEHVRIGHVYMVRTAMWFPVVVWAWLGLWRGPRRRRALAATGLATGLLILSGHPQIFTYAVFAWGLLALAAATHALRDGRAAAGALLGRSALAGAVGLAIAAPQLLPLAQLSALSGRAYGGLAVANVLAWPGLGWLHTIWPTLLVRMPGAEAARLLPHWEHGAYVGALALCLAAVGALSAGWPGRRLALVAFLFGVAYALGRLLPVLGLTVTLLPPLGRFRVPARMLFFALWGFGLLAGRGADLLREGAWTRRRLATAAAVAAAFLVAGAATIQVLLARGALGRLAEFHQLQGRVEPAGWAYPDLWAQAATLALAPLALALIARRLRGRGAALAIAALLVTNLGLGFRIESSVRFAPPRTHFPHDDVRADTPLGRVFVRQAPTDSMASLLTGQHNVDGRGPFLLRRLEAYLMRAGDVDWVRDESYLLNPALAACDRVNRYALLDVRRAVCTDGDATRVVAPPAHGHAWFVTDVRGVRDDVQALARVAARDFDPAREVVLAEADAGGSPPAAQAGESATIALVDAGEQWQRWRVDAPARGVFVVSELAYPGWRVEVNGWPAAALRADFLLRGVWLDAGVAEVTWRYAPRSYRMGALACALGLAACALALGWPRRPGGQAAAIDAAS